MYAYAMWISPALHLKVIRTFDAVATGQRPAPQLSHRELLMMALEQENRLLAQQQLAERATKIEQQQAQLAAQQPADDILKMVTESATAAGDTAALAHIRRRARTSTHRSD